MTKPIVGIDVEDLRKPPKEGLRAASEAGFRAVELAAISGDVAPQNLSGSGRRHVIRLCEGLGLNLSALTADFPGLRFTDPRSVDERVQRTCEVLELAADLRVPVVAAAAGAITHPQTGEALPSALEALARIGEFADSRGVLFAVRPSQDSGDRVAAVLAALRCPSIRVGLDPAALVASGVDPMALLRCVPRQVALLHARDGTAGSAETSGRETRLGEGDVDWMGVLTLLDAAEYRGSYILRRTEAVDPMADLNHGREVIERLLSYT